MTKLNRLDLAHLAIKKYIEKQPSDYKGYIQQAMLYIKQKKGNEAINALTLAVKHGGENARKDLRADKRFDVIRNSSKFRQLVPPPSKKNAFNWGTSVF